MCPTRLIADIDDREGIAHTGVCIHYELHVAAAESYRKRVRNPLCCTRTLTQRPHAEQQAQRTRQRTAQERERVATLPPGVPDSAGC